MFNKSKLLTLTVVAVLGQNAFGGDTREEDRGRGRGYEPYRRVSPEQVAALKKILLATAEASSASPAPDSSPDLTRSTSPASFVYEPYRRVSPEQVAALKKFLLATAEASSASPAPDSSPDLTRSISPASFGK